ncbi:energy transducer TonB [Chryseobacterium angstadtii]|uniref:energy transducer TonB n=1 Tax=Chryseobacterium angstadtii TaxID=558151 RepID=UPI00065AF212|nr:energy transducer TonB [Chryseobacterium angstadtii]
MKKIIVLAFLLISVTVFSQTQPKEDSKDQKVSTTDTQKPIQTDVAAEFPGGMDALRRHISSQFDSSKINDSGVFKSVTKFLIHTDGSMSSISTTGNNPAMNKEMTRVIKAIKNKWKPATRDGQPVETWYTIPMTINI